MLSRAIRKICQRMSLQAGETSKACSLRPARGYPDMPSRSERFGNFTLGRKKDLHGIFLHTGIAVDTPCELYDETILLSHPAQYSAESKRLYPQGFKILKKEDGPPAHRAGNVG